MRGVFHKRHLVNIVMGVAVCYTENLLEVFGMKADILNVSRDSDLLTPPTVLRLISISHAKSARLLRRATRRTTYRWIITAALFGLFLLCTTAVPKALGIGMFTYEGANTANSQNVALLEAAANKNPAPLKGGGEIIIVDEKALQADATPARGKGILVMAKNDQIATYVVREGDTLSEIAEMFEVSVNTIRWANDIPRSGTIAPGDKLVILPVSGVRYTVKEGDTVASLAKKYDANEDEIREFNGISDNRLAAGDSLLIPNGVIQSAAPSRPSSQGPSIARPASVGGVATEGYFIRPVSGTKTQGIHGYNGVDFSAPYGTSVYAAAAGEVIVSRASGWNGGYGQYIVIKHQNGTQTLYAHLSATLVSAGESVAQGTQIARSGSTGRSTGPHLHFEVRGGKNPF